MRIELEFLDRTKCRVHEKEILYQGTVPIPSAGETACIEGRIWRISKRDFIYIDGTEGIADVKISFWCEKV